MASDVAGTTIGGRRPHMKCFAISCHFFQL